MGVSGETRVYIDSGEVCKIEEIEPGDYVMDEHGEPVKVRSVIVREAEVNNAKLTRTPWGIGYSDDHEFMQRRRFVGGFAEWDWSPVVMDGTYRQFLKLDQLHPKIDTPEFPIDEDKMLSMFGFYFLIGLIYRRQRIPHTRLTAFGIVPLLSAGARRKSMDKISEVELAALVAGFPDIVYNPRANIRLLVKSEGLRKFAAEHLLNFPFWMFNAREDEKIAFLSGTRWLSEVTRLSCEESLVMDLLYQETGVRPVIHNRSKSVSPASSLSFLIHGVNHDDKAKFRKSNIARILETVSTGNRQMMYDLDVPSGYATNNLISRGVSDAPEKT
jgi:hypothetical protein